MEPWRSERLRRKQLGVLFATLDGDRAGAERHYLHDDQVFARRAQRFLAEHHARYPVRLYDARGRYLFHCRPKLDVLVKALNYAVAHGRDNELFVLLVDLIDLADDLDHLIRAVRVAVARHHQVHGHPAVAGRHAGAAARAAGRRRPHPAAKGRAVCRRRLQGDRGRTEPATSIDGYHKAYFKIRREFGRLGVIVVRADHGEPVQIGPRPARPPARRREAEMSRPAQASEHLPPATAAGRAQLPGHGRGWAAGLRPGHDGRGNEAGALIAHPAGDRPACWPDGPPPRC